MAQAYSSKGVSIWLSTDNVGTLISTATAITQAKNPVLSVPSTTGMSIGDVVFVETSGLKSLDGKYFYIGKVVADTSIELHGADTSTDTATLTTGPTQKIHVFETANFTKLCLSQFTIQQNQASPINVGTFCDPSATIPGNVGATGSIQLGGFVDTAAADYKLLLTAAEDRLNRVLRVDLPGTQGHIIASGVIGDVNITVPLDNAITWSSSMSLVAKPQHVWDGK